MAYKRRFNGEILYDRVPQATILDAKKRGGPSFASFRSDMVGTSWYDLLMVTLFEWMSSLLEIV